MSSFLINRIKKLEQKKIGEPTLVICAHDDDSDAALAKRFPDGKIPQNVIFARWRHTYI